MSFFHSSGSLDYKTIDPVIQAILDKRTRLNNTSQLSMPFIKVTTTLDGRYNDIIGNGNIGFTLGLHGIDENVLWEDMFSEQNSDMPLIGYTYGSDGNIYKRYAKDFNLDLFFNGKQRATTTEPLNRLPPPGITQVKIGRNKNGLLASGQFTISIPSLVQLESLQKTFLIPGVGVILEWGQQFAPTTDAINTEFGESGLADITLSNYVFPWRNHDEARLLLTRLGYNKVGLPEIITKYVYPTQGQYMWMFGRIANFTVNGNSDGSFESTVKIVGPSEDAWAYSVKNTVVPPRDASVKVFCSNKTNSIYSYFTETIAGPNFKTKLDDTKNGNSPWKNHVIKFGQGNSSEGKAESEKTSPITSQKMFGDLQDAYFISWRFFVNEILNGLENSVKSAVFANALTTAELQKVGMLLPFADGPLRENTNVATIPYINDPYESFVGFNDHLRSIDPSVMIIVNERAIELAKQSNQYKPITSEKDIFEPSEDSKKFFGEYSELGRFDESAKSNYPNKPDAGFLSTGVWLNHKTICECMVGADTLMRGISNLLERMNAASANYWQLALDTIEPSPSIDTSYNYIVVDANYRENSENSVNRFIDNVYTFNKLTRVLPDSEELVGSELINCSVDLSLPKKLFSQIATLGLVQPEDLQKIANPESDAPSPPSVSDPNYTIRELFAEISTSLIAVSDDTQGPDLTIPPKIERQQLIDAQKTCGATNSGTTAETSGTGYRANLTDVTDNLMKKDVDELTNFRQTAVNQSLVERCDECKTCIPEGTAPPVSPNLPLPTTTASPQISQVKLELVRGYQAKLQESRQTRSTRPIKDYVARREGTYDSINTGTAGDTPLYEQKYYSLLSNRKLSTLTLKEILQLIQPTGKVSAIGKYQAIPGTLRNWISEKNVNTDLVFNRELQEQLGDWLVTEKRPILGRFINGDTSVTVNQAHVELAKEFESVLVPDTTMGRFRQVTIGESYYAGRPLSRTPAPTPTAVVPRISCNQLYTEIGMSNPLRATNSAIETGRAMCESCTKAKEVLKQIDQILPAKQVFANSSRQYSGLQNALRYVELFPDFMVSNITSTANGVFSNAFGASPGSLSISADIELPGIAGIRVGELFWIDRIPSFYKIFGAFQVLSIEDTVDTSGWITKIHARFNYLGKTWKETMGRILPNSRGGS